MESDPTRYKRLRNDANNNYKSSVNRESIVECTKRGKAGRQGEEKEKFPTPTKPVQFPAAPLLLLLPDFPSFLPSLHSRGEEMR